MRVLHVLNSGTAGGAPRSTVELALALRAHDIQSFAAVHARPDEVAESLPLEAFRDRSHQVRLYRWNKRTRSPIWRRPVVGLGQAVLTGCGLRGVRRLVALIEAHDIDVIHTSTFVNPEGAMAAAITGRPHVWHVRELVGPGRPVRIRGEGRRLARATEGSVVIANSEATAHCLSSVLPGIKPVLIPNGLPIEALASRLGRPRLQRDRQRSRLVVGMVANLTASWKRHELFVQAAAIASSRCDSPLEFRIYGQDPSRDPRLRGVAYAERVHELVDALGLRPNFLFMGFADGPAEYMAEIDILVQPTESESFGRVVVEAMASGVPVVGVDGGPFGEIIAHGDAGIMASAGDAASIARGVLDLVSDTALRDRIRARGLDRALEQYSIERCAARVAEVYIRATTSLGVPSTTARAFCRVQIGRFL